MKSIREYLGYEGYRARKKEKLRQKYLETDSSGLYANICARVAGVS